MVTGFSIIFSNRVEKSIYKRSQGDLNPCAALHGSTDFENCDTVFFKSKKQKKLIKTINSAISFFYNCLKKDTLVTLR
ncbi:Hypothetical protein LLKF_0091 [Lactococcus lactis subsp. lactis KF147]|nr:Hypothetical protein LLKF_0091 [Lactococcus lactis subsp. lactis KF147]